MVDIHRSARRISLVDPGQLDQAGGAVLDVRQRAETAAGHLPGARTIELGGAEQWQAATGRALARG